MNPIAEKLESLIERVPLSEWTIKDETFTHEAFPGLEITIEPKSQPDGDGWVYRYVQSIKVVFDDLCLMDLNIGYFGTPSAYCKLGQKFSDTYFKSPQCKEERFLKL